jgi:hypothetical protein
LDFTEFARGSGVLVCLGSSGFSGEAELSAILMAELSAILVAELSAIVVSVFFADFLSVFTEYDSATAILTRTNSASSSSFVKGELDADWLAMMATHTSFSRDCMLGSATPDVADSVIWLPGEGTDEAEQKRPFIA